MPTSRRLTWLRTRSTASTRRPKSVSCSLLPSCNKHSDCRVYPLVQPCPSLLSLSDRLRVIPTLHSPKPPKQLLWLSILSPPSHLLLYRFLLVAHQHRRVIHTVHRERARLSRLDRLVDGHGSLLRHQLRVGRGAQLLFIPTLFTHHKREVTLGRRGQTQVLHALHDVQQLLLRVVHEARAVAGRLASREHKWRERRHVLEVK